MTPLQTQLNRLQDRQPFQFPASEVPAHFGKAAVLILLWEEAGQTYTLFTLRASHLSSFPGQVCFPGGRLDAGESFAAAALRETEEETGIGRNSAKLVCRLDDAWSGGGYLMVPWIGYLPGRPQTRANDEVARIFHLPINDQLDFTCEPREHRGIHYQEHFLDYDGERIFGLTVDLLQETIDLLYGRDHSRGANRLQHLRHFRALPDTGPGSS